MKQKLLTALKIAFIVIVIIAFCSGIASFVKSDLADHRKAAFWDHRLEQMKQEKPVFTNYRDGTIVSNGVEIRYHGRFNNIRETAVVVKLDDGEVIVFDLNIVPRAVLKDYKLIQGEKVLVRTTFKPYIPSQLIELVSPSAID